MKILFPVVILVTLEVCFAYIISSLSFIINKICVNFLDEGNIIPGNFDFYSIAYHNGTLQAFKK